MILAVVISSSSPVFCFVLFFLQNRRVTQTHGQNLLMRCVRFPWQCTGALPRGGALFLPATCVHLCSDAAVNLTGLLPMSLEGISHPIDGCLEDKKFAQKEICTHLHVHCWLHHVQISRVSEVLTIIGHYVSVRVAFRLLVPTAVPYCSE